MTLPQTPLRLIALDADDVTVVASHLQDAVGVVGDMAYQPRERRFVALLNRYDWAEANADPSSRGVRRRSALRIERVTAAQVQGLDLKAKGEVLSVLTVLFEPDADIAKAPAGQLTLVLAGRRAIRLAVECVELQLEDLGPVWAARTVPRHDGGDTEGSGPS